MKIVVPIKRVPDPYSKIKVNTTGDGIETQGLKYEINPFDEIAVEEAVRLSEKHGAEVTVVTIGVPESEEQIRKALAMGADKGILIETDALLDSLGIAKILKKIVENLSPEIVIMGKQAIDDDCNQAGQMLAALLGWPQATFASKVVIEGDRAEVTRETDKGQETLSAHLPLVITTDLRLNEPRYVALPGIIKARTKPIETITLFDLNVNAECQIRTVHLDAPSKRKTGRKVESVDELIEALKNEAGVLR
jgi:electron transfer flavoprotein beta subunit